MYAELNLNIKKMLNEIPEFKSNGIWIIESTLKERYAANDNISLKYADSEIRIDSSDRELTVCPVIFWEHESCSFVIIKTAEKNYRCQFFYRVHQQFGTGINNYDDITECVVTLLQALADRDSNQAKKQTIPPQVVG